MTCTQGIDKNGNRFIACTRGMPKRDPLPEDVSRIASSSPWAVGARVRHQRYGDGTIIRRNSAAVTIAFDDPEQGRHSGTMPATERSFLLAYVGKGMEVLP